MKEMVHGLTQICRGERGIALSLALMCLMVLASLSAAMLAIGGSEVQIAANLLRDTQARFIAEAGLEDAFNYYRSDTSRLPASNATLSATVTDVTSNLSGPGTGLQGYGSYAVTAQIVGPYTVLLTSTGTSATGSASKMLRAPSGSFRRMPCGPRVPSKSREPRRRSRAPVAARIRIGTSMFRDPRARHSARA